MRSIIFFSLPFFSLHIQRTFLFHNCKSISGFSYIRQSHLLTNNTPVNPFTYFQFQDVLLNDNCTSGSGN